MKVQEVKRSAMYLRLSTRDRINLFKARFSPVVGRVLTQDETIAVLMDAWDAQHDDGEAAEFASGGPRQ